MKFPDPSNVTPRWRRLAYVLNVVVICAFSSWFVVQSRAIFRAGVQTYERIEPGFGNLPVFRFCNWPNGTTEDTFGYYHVKAWRGMELAPGVSKITVTLSRYNQCVVFNMSAVSLPDFQMVRQEHPHEKPMPALEFVILYKRREIEEHVEGLMMYADDPITGQELILGSYRAYHKPWSEGYKLRNFLSFRKQVVEKQLTEPGFTSLWEEFSVASQRYQFHQLYSHITKNGHCNNTQFTPLSPDGEPACTDSWKTVSVALKFPSSWVSVIVYEGPWLTWLHFASSVGGLLAVASGILWAIFTKKNSDAKIVKVYDELTLISERFLGDQDKDDSEDSSTE